MSFFALLLGAGLVFFAWFFYKSVLRMFLLRRKLILQGVPATPFRPFIGDIPLIKRYRAKGNYPFCLFKHFQKRFGSKFVYFLGPEMRLVISSDKGAQQVLLTNDDCFVKPDLMVSMFRIIFGNGILLSSGDFWKRQRKMMNPAFSHSVIKQMVQGMISSTEDSFATLDNFANSETEVNMHEQITHVTLSIIGSTSFGANIGGSSDTAKQVFSSVGQLLETLMRFLFSGTGLIPFWEKLPLPTVTRMFKSQTYLNAIILDYIKDRRSGRSLPPENRSDLLQLLLDARDDDKTGMNDEQVLHEAMTIFVAGHETTAQLVTWTLYVLAEHPEWRERVQAEADDLLSSGADLATAPMKDITCVLNETLRLYPPAPMISRKCVEAHTIDGIQISPQMSAAIPICLLHRDPDNFDDPDAFKPERFENGVSQASKRPGVFLPFSNGPRNCIGKNFAMTEAKVMLAMLAHRYDWRLSPNYVHNPEMAITLRPKTGMQMFLSRRN